MRHHNASSQPAAPPSIKYTPLWVEGLAYHEAGHAVMALTLGIQVERVAIANACEMPDTNGFVLYKYLQKITILNQALCHLASEPAERLAPNYPSLKNLRGFASGRRNDKTLAFFTHVPVYRFAGYVESTARRLFRERTTPLLARIMGQSGIQAVVHDVAMHLMEHREMDAAMVESFRGRTALPSDVYRALKGE